MYNPTVNKKTRAKYVLEEMEKLFPDSSSELRNWETDFQFLLCIILSAQTTDLQVNKVTHNLFAKYPDPASLSEAEVGEVEKILSSINYYRTKSKNIVNAAKVVKTRFHGRVPRSVEKLIEIPGVGLKTANVYLNSMYQANQGVGADTHVMRVSRRLGFTDSRDPRKVAIALQKLYPKKDWYRVTALFVLYGRYYCKARVKPENSKCIFKEFCTHCSGLDPYS
ncbi:MULTISPECIES: endonuclease III domain-containing protein [Gammaproteobacteria]|uniref:Endonuclease III n=20 Tax=Gammaproteobacteria TaxID=1236 RepID=G3F9Q5_ECOLX|nr:MULTISPECIES: endonuclease III [Gammaproteobacteria]AIM48379.1 Endonuclease III [Providencia stuartii]AJD76946.1 EcoRIII [Serratia marcescens]AMP34729.1 Ultraviolet N-glycosylase/AP lyase [Salmonella enterica subsp. enterica serovar Stanley]QJT93695.1 endonuclease III [Pseudomonas aeruginosa]AEN71468.1 endonuclease III [Escherichia coli]